MEFNTRHRKALRYFARYPNTFECEPYGIGKHTMKPLVENGYVIQDRARIGWAYKITPKGARIVGQWIESDNVQSRLDKWNAAVKGKGRK